MNGDENRCGSRQRRKCQITELRRAIDDYNVIEVLRLGYCLADAGKKQGISRCATHQGAGRVVFEFHKLQVARNDMEIWNIGATNDLGDRPAFVVVTDRAIKRFIRTDINLRLMTEESGQTGLRIEIDGKYPVTAQRQILRQMRRCRGFARTALEVHDRNDLQLFTVTAMRQIAACATRALIEEFSDLVHILDGIGTTAGSLRRIELRTLGGDLAKIGFADADQPCGFRR